MNTRRKNSIVAHRDSVRSSILDAAEKIFAEEGFDGSTTRQIAQEAGVNLAMIHYHYETKERLFSEVIARRAARVNEQRKQMLMTVMADPAGPTLPAVFRALMQPTMEFGKNGAAGQYYSQLMARITAGNDERSKKLVSENFDWIAAEFIKAIRAAAPELTRDRAARAYLNAIFLGVFLIARTGRLGKLAGGDFDEFETNVALKQTIDYLCAGTRALIPEKSKKVRKQ